MIELMFLKTSEEKASKSRECDICHYWYLLNKWFKFKAYVCNGCHDL